MSKKQMILGGIAAVLVLALTIFLATSAFMRDVFIPLITGILEVLFTIFTSPPDQYLWVILLAVTLPVLFLQLIRHLLKITAEPTHEAEEKEHPKGATERYSEWVDEMDESSFINAKMRQIIARIATRATQHDSIGQMLNDENEQIPPRVAEYFSLFTSQQRGTGNMATAAMLDETLTWLEGRLEI